MSLIAVKQLCKSYHKKWAVQNVSFAIAKQETLAIVGESGSGKTSLAKCLLRLLPVDSGDIFVEGIDVLKMSPADFRRLRPQLQMIYQHPGQALNPKLTAGESLMEPLRIHGKLNRQEAQQQAVQLLKQVGLSKKHFDRRSYELSGGQQQRVVIARALSTRPVFLIADEPTSSLDANVRGHILSLLANLKHSYGLTMMLITHNVRLAARMADRIGVMYQGELIEVEETEQLISQPQHAYTRQLLEHSHFGSFSTETIHASIQEAVK